jgi:hypothetical protein
VALDTGTGYSILFTFANFGSYYQLDHCPPPSFQRHPHSSPGVGGEKGVGGEGPAGTDAVRQEARDGGVAGAEAGGVRGGGGRACVGGEEGRAEEGARLEKLSEFVTKS